MMSEIDHKLPESLRKQLRSFRVCLWRVRLLEMLFCSLLCILCSYLVFFVSDRLWDTPLPLGWGLLMAGACGLLLWSPYWLVRWIWKRRHADQLARLICRKMPSLGDKLLGVVELEGAYAQQLSPSLHAAAMRQVAEESLGVDLKQAIPHPRHKLFFVLFLFLSLMIGLLISFVPDAALNSLVRWSNPTVKIERYTFAKLKPYDECLVVPLGESVVLSLALAENTELKPALLTFHLGGMKKEVPLDSTTGIYDIRIPCLQKEENLSFSVGDCYGLVRIIPKMRPTVLRSTLKLEYPKYLGRADDELVLRVGSGAILEGSKASLVITASEDVDVDTAILQGTDAQIQSIQGDNITSQSFAMDSKVKEWSLKMKDKHGLSMQKEAKFILEPLKDQMPVVELRSGAREYFLLEEETLSLNVKGSDDYGLQCIGVEWAGEQAEGEKLAPLDPVENKKEQILEKGFSAAVALSGDFLFQASALKISPQRVQLRAFTQDYYPGRSRVYSEPITVYVLTLMEHAQMIRAEMDRLNNQIEEISRQMELLSDETKRLQALAGEELQHEDSQSRLREMADQEQRLAQQLEDIDKKGNDLFKQAARNKDIDSEAMRNFMEALQMIAPLPSGEMKSAAEGFESSAEMSNTPEKAQQELKEGTEQHEKAKETLKKAQNKLAQAAAKLEASTFVARLRQAAKNEDTVASLLCGQLESIGLSLEEMDPAQQRSFEQIIHHQAQVGRDVFWISEDLSYYQSRSTEPVFAELYKMMGVYDIPTQMDEFLQQINETQTANAIRQAKSHAITFREWAQYIDDYKKKAASGGGGGGGGGEDDVSMNEEDFEFMLKMMRMIQIQQDIRMRTRSLEEERRKMQIKPVKLP